MKIDEGVAIAALGVGVVEAMNLYRDAAPSLSDVRCADPTQAGLPTDAGWQYFAMHQQILDADMLAFIFVLVLGGGGVLLARRWYPLILASAAMLLLSAYYRTVLRSSNGGLSNG